MWGGVGGGGERKRESTMSMEALGLVFLRWRQVNPIVLDPPNWFILVKVIHNVFIPYFFLIWMGGRDELCQEDGSGMKISKMSTDLMNSLVIIGVTGTSAITPDNPHIIDSLSSLGKH